MKPTKVLETANSIWWRYLGQEVRWDLRRDVWTCTCLGFVYCRKCKHIKACKEALKNEIHNV